MDDYTILGRFVNSWIFTRIGLLLLMGILGGSYAAGVAAQEDSDDEQKRFCGINFEECPPLPAPSGLTAEATGGATVDISWDHTPGATKYRISGGNLANSETTGTSTSDSGLNCGTTYSYNVKGYGDGINYFPGWGDSASVSVRTELCSTPTPTNDPPAFSSASTSRSVPENTPSGRNIGTPVTATDPDGDSLTYSIGGTNASSFSIVPSSGQLKTSAALNYETKSSYSVTVTAEDPSDASDSITVTISVNNVDEQGTVYIQDTTPEEDVAITAYLTDVDGGVSNTSWQWQAKTSETPSGIPDWQNIHGATSSQYTPKTVDIGSPLRAKVTYADVFGSGKSAVSSPTAVVSKQRLQLPSNLTVTPMSLRRAELSWIGDTNATGYTIRVEQPNGNYGEVNIDGPTNTRNVIHLDNIMTDNSGNPQGLAQMDYFQFQVKAVDFTGTRLDSIFSEKVRIVDNPILTSGSAKKPSSGNVWIELQWDKIPDATSYTVEYRTLGIKIENDGRDIVRLHKDTDWPNDSQWPHYSNDSLKKTVSQPSGSTVSTEFSILRPDFLYGFQVNYELDERAEPGAEVELLEVFSARDAYAWTSRDVPGFTERVGTYTFFGFWENGRYDYTICSDTFDDPTTSLEDESTEWLPLIEHAFAQWQEAVPDELTVNRVPGTCTTEHGPIDNSVPITVLRALFNESNEVYMVDQSNWDQKYTGIVWTNPLFRCIRDSPACVISPRYLDLRSHLLPGEPVRVLDDGTVDVLVNASRQSESLEIPYGDSGIEGDATVDADDIGLNTCLPIILATDDSGNPYRSSDPDHGYGNYGLLLHEAGHALGLSGGSLMDLPSERGRYEMAHPTIPDSALNYDWEVPQIAYEPDCSPHPFDIMAIYALYQNVSP